ncbi:MAG: stage II sporulation protein M [Nanoarchaeota archaeon]
MLESLINPRRVEKGPWKMFFVGIVYASLSLLLVKLFFENDPVFFNGLTVVLFCVMFSLPFMYYLIKVEEEQDEHIEGFFSVWRAHSDAIYAFIWLFLGFIVAFSFWNIVLGDAHLFNAQLETYCKINSPGNVEKCIELYSFTGKAINIQGSSTVTGRLLSIIQNNMYVMIFTLIFSLIFGAGAIFVLAWNASVISTAIAIFTRYQIADIPLGILRYMVHGFPEITAYFITALAGGMLGTGIIRHGIKDKLFLRVLENVIILIFIAILIVLLAAFIEVYLTPLLFS